MASSRSAFAGVLSRWRQTCHDSPYAQARRRKNGAIAKGAIRWRCPPTCGSSTTRHRTTLTLTRDFTSFHTFATGTADPNDIADAMDILRRSLDHRFKLFWLIDNPNTPNTHRVCDQVFIESTYIAGRLPATTASPLGTGYTAKRPTPRHSYYPKSHHH